MISEISFRWHQIHIKLVCLTSVWKTQWCWCICWEHTFFSKVTFDSPCKLMTFDKPFVQKAVDNNLENSVCVEYFWKCISFRKVHPIPKTCIGAINLWEFMQTMTDDTHFVRNRYWLKIVLETHRFSKKWHQQSNTTQSLLTTILTQSQFGNDKLWKRMVLDHSFLASLHPCFPPSTSPFLPFCFHLLLPCLLLSLSSPRLLHSRSYIKTRCKTMFGFSSQDRRLVQRFQTARAI